jgi:hypothetical protein
MQCPFIGLLTVSLLEWHLLSALGPPYHLLFWGIQFLVSVEKSEVKFHVFVFPAAFGLWSELWTSPGPDDKRVPSPLSLCNLHSLSVGCP